MHHIVDASSNAKENEVQIWWDDILQSSSPVLCIISNDCCNALLYILAATKQLYEWFSPSVCPSHLFDYVPIIVPSWNFQELLPMTEVMFMQKVKVIGQGHRGHNPT